MVIDHIDVIWRYDTIPLMGLIGRGTFPLFCYAVAVAVLRIEGGSQAPVEKKKKYKTYLRRLLILALVSQPVYYFAFASNTANVLFTLAAGVVMAALSYRLRLWQVYLVYSIALVSMLWILPVEFGLSGVMVPSAIILVLRGQKGASLFLALLLIFMNAGGFLHGLQHHINPLTWYLEALSGVFAIVLPWMVLDMARGMKQTGRFLPKYALYIFYPVHLALLKLLVPFI